MSRSVAVLAVCLWAGTAWGQSADAPDQSAPSDNAALPPPTAPEPPTAPQAADLPPAPAATTPKAPAFEPPTGDISLEDWNRDDWMLVKPATSLIDLHGYFRLRGDLFRKLDFGNATPIERTFSGGTTGTTATIQPRYGADSAAGGGTGYAATNMRLRLEPRVNVTDRIQVVTTLDVLDNIVLGSTPDTLPHGGTGTPVNVLSRGQQSPRAGYNALVDSIAVKRAYARLTALNEQLELKFGRVPNHWGLGVLTNDGDCLDCDYGDVADRLAITFRAAGHLFTPMYDWISTGPVATPFGRSGGQPIDALDSDDAGQYALQIMREDHPADVKDLTRQGDTVLNYGVWTMFRTQKTDLPETYYNPADESQRTDPAAPVTVGADSRDAVIFTIDGYGKLYSGPFTLKAEGAFVYGSFKDANVNSVLDKSKVYKLGGALEGLWQMPGQRPGSTVSLMTGGASGDKMPGFGTLDRADTQRGENGGRLDHGLDNFQFSPDYHVDLLMFRRIIGTVTDAWYVKPGVTYMFDDKFAGKLAAIYSQAIFKETLPGSSRLMGLEFDAELSYGLEGAPDASPFGAALAGGLAFPFNGFKNPTNAADSQSGSFAWTIQARLYVAF